MFVGNNWDGTATVVDVAHPQDDQDGSTSSRTVREELLEIYAAPDRLAFYLAIQQVVGEGHDQYVDDMFTTRDGNLVAVSRPSFSDVVWIDLATGKVVAEQQMDGYRTDHMDVSPDGRRLLVSDSTDRSVHEYVMGGKGDPATGKRLRTFESGDTPHESNYQQERQADLPRQHRPGLHAGRLPRARPGAGRRRARHGQGRPLARGRRQPDVQGRSAAGTWARSWPRPATRT